MLASISSLMGIILLITGYSKIYVKLEITDVFDPITGANYSLEKIMESIKRNFDTTVAYYYIVLSGFSVGISFASTLAIIVINFYRDMKEDSRPTDTFVIQNPLRPTEQV